MNELKRIKRLYGENFSKLCKAKFPTILLEPGMLLSILTENFQPSHSLYDDIIKNDMTDSFLQFIVSCYEEKKGVEAGGFVEREETPEELMAKAGYKLVKCETIDDIFQFAHYYQPTETLCTFGRAIDRLKECEVFFAVREDADTVPRGNPPKREDPYGTSVISLQFSKITGLLSIKNRYNHTIRDKNPDATFDNNLENIIPGLTNSFVKHYNIDVKVPKTSFSIPGYVRDYDGKQYKYNYEINNVYYCENNIVIKHGVVTEYSKDRYDLIDYFLLDKQNAQLHDLTAEQEFVSGNTSDDLAFAFRKAKKVEIVNAENSGRKFIVTDHEGNAFEIGVDKSNRIISYSDAKRKSMISFMTRAKYVQKIDIPNLEKMGRFCFGECDELKELYLPKLKSMQNDNFYSCRNLEKVQLDSLEEMGNNCFRQADSLTFLSMPHLKGMGRGCFYDVSKLTNLYLPEIESLGQWCFHTSLGMKEIVMPKLKTMGENCFASCKSLQNLSMDSLERMEQLCFVSEDGLTELSLPSLTYMGRSCFYENETIRKISMENLTELGAECFVNNDQLRELSLNSAKVIGPGCFRTNRWIEKLLLDNVERIGKESFKHNEALEQLVLPNVQQIDEECFERNVRISKLVAPKLSRLGIGAFRDNQYLRQLTLESIVEMCGDNFKENSLLETLIAPQLRYVARNCFKNNTSLENMETPMLREVDSTVFENNPKAKAHIKKILSDFYDVSSAQ